MNKLTEQGIIQLIESDRWMMNVIQVVASLYLPDWWIGAGFVRNKVWDYLHEYNSRTPLGDIDVIYFDRYDLSEDREKELERKLAEMIPGLPWSVKNQARMHLVNRDEPYFSSTEALSKWPETATSVAVTLSSEGKLILNTPHGVDDLVDLVLRPTPVFHEKMEIYKKRQEAKGWKSKWPRLRYCVDFPISKIPLNLPVDNR